MKTQNIQRAKTLTQKLKDKNFKSINNKNIKHLLYIKTNPKKLNNSNIRNKFRSHIEIVKIIIIISFLSKVISKSNMFIIVFSLSNKITLKIKGPGIKNIFSRSFSNNKYPQKIYINEQIQTDITYHYNFTKAKNTVLLIWENIIYDFIEMFNK